MNNSSGATTDLVTSRSSKIRIQNYVTKLNPTYLFTYLLTPWCRVLLEKLTGLQLVKNFPAFHGTRRFITALTSVRQLSLSWASPIQSIYAHPTSWRSILMLSTLLRLGIPSGNWTVLHKLNAGLTTLPLSCAYCLEIWEPKTPGTLRACPGLYKDCFTCYRNQKISKYQFSNDVELKLATFLQLIGTIRRTILRKWERKLFWKYTTHWLYVNFYMGQKTGL